MKTKLVKQDIELKTQADCYRALLDGYCLMRFENIAATVKLIDGMLHDVRLESKDTCWSFDKPAHWEVYKEEKVEWYDNIPEQGILCWVTKSKNSITEIDVVFSYSNGKFIDRNNAYWLHATPLTEGEVNQYIYKE